jgi:hypothetical protein
MPVPFELEVGEERFLAEVPDEDRAADLEDAADERLADLFRSASRRLEDGVALGVEGAKDGLVSGDVVEDDLGDPGKELAGHAASFERVSCSHLSDERGRRIFSLRRLGGIP